MRIDDKIAAKKAEVAEAQQACARAAYLLAQVWRKVGNQHIEETPEAVDATSYTARATVGYVDAEEQLRRRCDELAVLVA